MRIKIIKYSVIFLFAVIVINLFYLQAIRGAYYYKLSAFNRIRVIPLQGWRGKIYDRNNTVLADNELSYNVLVIPQEIKNSLGLINFLSEALETDKKKLEDNYRRNKGRGDFVPVVIAESIKREQAIRIEEEKYLHPGLLVEESFRRFYPLGANSAHVLGYVGRTDRSRLAKFKDYGFSPQSITGYSGVEEYYDAYLKGEEGGLQVEINSAGEQVRLLGWKEPKKGQDIQLTIDAKLQSIIEESLFGINGSVVIMETDTGEVLGLTNNPSFDPNIFIDSKRSKEKVTLLNDVKSPLINRAISAAYPPGSAFKVPVALAGLERKKVSANTNFTCNGSLEKGGITFGCTHSHGPQNLLQAIAHSCNVYFYNLGIILGSDIIAHYAKMLGLGLHTHIDLPYEEPGNIPSRRETIFKQKKWYTGNTINMSIGQGDVLSTPVQLVKMMAIVANEGKIVQPHVIKSIGEIVDSRFKSFQRILINRSVFEAMNKSLRATVTEFSGTAHVAAIDNLFVAGKTGTAQTGSKSEPHAWFVGYARGTKRNITFCVFLEFGGSSQNACLLARQIMLKMRENGLL
ncbi:MAG: penicillin-binding protein 2 [Candidatus Omnitrophica bacterium]|nr:penicillin-binding protein 2 [Candidatus Omnitrophota bacterium]